MADNFDENTIIKEVDEVLDHLIASHEALDLESCFSFFSNNPGKKLTLFIFSSYRIINISIKLEFPEIMNDIFQELMIMTYQQLCTITIL